MFDLDDYTSEFPHNHEQIILSRATRNIFYFMAFINLLLIYIMFLSKSARNSLVRTY